MSNPTTLPSIDTTTLTEVTGGLIRSAGGLGLGSSSNFLAAQLPLQLAQAQIANQQNTSRDWMPLMFALAMR